MYRSSSRSGVALGTGGGVAVGTGEAVGTGVGFEAGVAVGTETRVGIGVACTVGVGVGLGTGVKIHVWIGITAVETGEAVGDGGRVVAGVGAASGADSSHAKPNKKIIPNRTMANRRLISASFLNYRRNVSGPDGRLDLVRRHPCRAWK